MAGIAEWLAENYPTLASAVGLGSASSLATKKWIDKEQDKKIKAVEVEVQEIKTKLEVNTRLDAERQAQLAIHLASIDKRFDRMDDKLDRILENQQNKRR